MRKFIFLSLLVISLVGCTKNEDLPKNNKKVLKLKEDVFFNGEYLVEYGDAYSTNPADYIDADESILNETEIEVANPYMITYGEGEYDDFLITDIYRMETYEAVAIYKDEKINFKIKIRDSTPPTFALDQNRQIYILQNASTIDFERYFDADDMNGVSYYYDKGRLDLSLPKLYVDFEIIAVDAKWNERRLLLNVIVVTQEEVDNGEVVLSNYTDGSDPYNPENILNQKERWVGYYEYEEPNLNRIYNLRIYRENGEYVALYEVDGWITSETIKMKVVGDENSIDFVSTCEKYYSDYNDNCSLKEVLFTMYYEEDILYTEWDGMQPVLDKHRENGVYFEEKTWNESMD